MDWVGKAVEAVSDQSLEVYFRENIFGPLGMTDTGFFISPAQKARVAQMYSREGDGSLKPNGIRDAAAARVLHGWRWLFSTPRNYMAFLQMLLHDGTFNGAQVLKPETVALMRQNQIGDLNVETLKTVDPATSNDAQSVPGHGAEMGAVVRHQHRTGAGGTKRGQHRLGRCFQHLFLARPAQACHRRDITQLLPFADDRVLKLFAEFESGLYKAVASA